MSSLRVRSGSLLVAALVAIATAGLPVAAADRAGGGEPPGSSSRTVAPSASATGDAPAQPLGGVAVAAATSVTGGVAAVSVGSTAGAEGLADFVVGGGLATAEPAAGGIGPGVVAAAAPRASDRVIVRFRRGSSFLPGSGPSRALVARDNVHLVVNPPGLSVDAALARYAADPNVVYAEPDHTITVARTPNDPLYATHQWDMARIGAPEAWESATDASSVVVAVIDTGIAYGHPDLASNLWSDPADPSVHGFTCTAGVCAPGGADDHGHGTHVAGTIGAAGDDSTGVAGVTWDVQLLSIKFLGSGGSGQISDAVAGFEKLRALKLAGVNIRVTNNSWGGGGYSQALADAMAALEVTPGFPSTLHVCAAGNSSVNADFTPMYPAAYPSRGIVSVLATDANDAGAWFTNYGVASVDIAAPGVGIVSSASTGTCSLCDPTGYRSLNGTSMASPHVAGVAAAILARHPDLSAAQARDALLRPASYQALTEAKARRTTTGGRLDFGKALANLAFYANPVLNAFPSVTVGPDVVTTPGSPVAFTQSASDPDGDPLRSSVGRGPIDAGSAWLFGSRVAALFPASPPFTAPGLARTAAVPYDITVSDDRGGGAAARNWAVVEPTAGVGQPPSGVLTVPATATVGQAVTIGFVATDPDGGPVAWDVWSSTLNGSGGSCCWTGTSVTRTFSTAGIYRISVTAMDRELLASPTYTAIISVGGTAGSPPVAEASLSVLSGTAPLTVTVDMSKSADTDGTLRYYFIGCGGSFTIGQRTPVGSCSFASPGTYWLLLQVQDDTGLMGLTSRYVVVTPTAPPPPPPPPPPPADTTPPSVAFLSPTDGSTVLETVTVGLAVADETGGSGVADVELFLDGTSATSSLGRLAAGPWSWRWDATTATTGGHTLIAIARDASGNTSVATRAVTVSRPVLPAVALTPSGSLTVKRRVRVDLAAAVNVPTYGIARVEFWVGPAGSQSLLCTDTVAPYGCAWTSPNATTSVSAVARAYDGRGNLASSNALSIRVR